MSDSRWLGQGLSILDQVSPCLCRTRGLGVGRLARQLLLGLLDSSSLEAIPVFFLVVCFSTFPIPIVVPSPDPLSISPGRQIYAFFAPLQLGRCPYRDTYKLVALRLFFVSPQRRRRRHKQHHNGCAAIAAALCAYRAECAHSDHLLQKQRWFKHPFLLHQPSKPRQFNLGLRRSVCCLWSRKSTPQQPDPIRERQRVALHHPDTANMV
mgnify:CR=1 FL=1